MGHMRGLRFLTTVFFLILAAAPLWGEGPGFSLTVNQAEDLGQNASVDLASTQAKARLEKLKYDWSLRSFFPTLSVGFSQNDTVSMNSADTFDKRLYFTVKQPLFDGGKSIRNRALAAVGLEQTLTALKAAKQTQRDTVWELYKKITLAQEKLAALKTTLEGARKEYRIAQARREVGEITELDVLDVEIRLTSLEVQLDSANNDLASQMTSLKELLHLGEGVDLVLSDRLEEDYEGFEIRHTPGDFLVAARTLNQGFAQSRLAKRKLDEAKVEADWAWAPTVSTEATFSASGNQFPLRQPGVNLSLSLSFPLPQAPVNVSLSAGDQPGLSRTKGAQTSADFFPDASVATTGEEWRIQVADWENQKAQLEIKIKDQARDFIARYAVEKKKLQSLKRALALEKRKLLLYQERLRIGEIKPADLVEEQQKVLQAQMDLWDGVMGLMLDERKMETLVGLPIGGLRQMEETLK